MAIQRTHDDMDLPNYGHSAEVGPHSARVNKVAYKRASLAARKWAKTKGVSPVKATKALSETTRNMVDMRWGTGKQAQSQITRGLNGLVGRLENNDRGGRTTDRGRLHTAKGEAADLFGKYAANEFLNSRPAYPKLRPKAPRGTVVAKSIGKIIR